ncbi:MAG: holo-ACP synthase [Christensenellaceae bacterium]|jgi:phosphopantetheine--protein transferase-like protein|nr:holo-ACP synthase [Christensenellaceae bacterium]
MHIGIDIIEAKRFADMNDKRLSQMFTSRELEYVHMKNFAPETIAGLFCAKEAFFKALGTGITHQSIMEIEILHDMHGAPYFHFNSTLLARHKHLSTAHTHLSISNTKELSVAICAIVPSYVNGISLN